MPDAGAPGARRLGRNVVVLAIVSFFTDASSEMIYPLLPLFLVGTLGASATALGAIEGAAESMASLLKLASGWWSDRVRRRKPLVAAGYLLASAVRPLVGLAQSATQVLLIRLTDRVGKGIRTSPRDALIADSVSPEARGRAFGFHRTGDHAGAVVGPLVAFALLEWAGVSLRTLFLLAAVPGALAVLVLVIGVREVPRERRGAPTAAPTSPPDAVAPEPPSADAEAAGALGRPFWLYLVVLLLFTLGNATDAFLLLRATELGVAASLVPILWAMLHVVKAVSSMPGGALSDRIGRRPLIVAGWALYAFVYVAFALASAEWHAWALFAVYGVFFGLTEGVEKALVADLVPARRRGVAFGWYNLALGLGALPASLLFGIVWDHFGARAAFGYGAALALAASAAIVIAVPRRAAA